MLVVIGYWLLGICHLLVSRYSVDAVLRWLVFGICYLGCVICYVLCVR